MGKTDTDQFIVLSNTFDNFHVATQKSGYIGFMQDGKLYSLLTKDLQLQKVK